MNRKKNWGEYRYYKKSRKLPLSTATASEALTFVLTFIKKLLIESFHVPRTVLGDIVTKKMSKTGHRSHLHGAYVS